MRVVVGEDGRLDLDRVSCLVYRSKGVGLSLKTWVLTN